MQIPFQSMVFIISTSHSQITIRYHNIGQFQQHLDRATLKHVRGIQTYTTTILTPSKPQYHDLTQSHVIQYRY